MIATTDALIFDAAVEKGRTAVGAAWMLASYVTSVSHMARPRKLFSAFVKEYGSIDWVASRKAMVTVSLDFCAFAAPAHAKIAAADTAALVLKKVFMINLPV